MSRRLDDRYDLLDELPHVTGGRLFRARDLAFGEIVGVKQLGPNCGLDSDARQHLENTIRHLQCLPHPHLSRVYAFEPRNGLIVQEWAQGIPVLDLLRRRRELPAGEALLLLASLPRTLDFMAREAIPIPRPLLGKLYVEFTDNVVGESVAETPVERWPVFNLKLNPLSLRGLLTETINETKTVVVDPRRPVDIQEGYGPRELALLIYELLGGRIREVDSRRFSPLSGLREAGNAVLRRELLGMPHADCESLWGELVAAHMDSARPSPVSGILHPPAVRSYQIPAGYLTQMHPGGMLDLHSYDGAALPIRLVTGTRFTIGRSGAAADFVARIAPEDDPGEARTNRLSRVHVLLEANAGQITVRDGHGQGPSLNGSMLDGQPLTAQIASVLPHRGRLTLAEEYALELIPLEAQEIRDWRIANLDSRESSPEAATLMACRALVCQPVEGHTLGRNAVWLFTEIGFGLDASGRLVWDTRGRGRSPAYFHHDRGCFWLRNHGLSEPILVDHKTPLGRGEILPLAPGQTLRLGAHVFSVQIQ